MKLYLFIPVLFLIACSQAKQDIPFQEKDFCANIHRNDTISLSKQLERVASLMRDKTGVYVLEEGEGALVTRGWLCEYAEQTIDVQYFIFSSDNVGLIACDYLVRAADRGVKVRIMVDDIMVEAGVHEILTLDSHENITIKIYNPQINLGKNIYAKLKNLATDFRASNQRMHNKTFLVDGKISITGGRNIADEYFDYDHEYNFRDRDVLLIGKTTTQIQNSFDTFWNSPLSIAVIDLVKEKDKIALNTNRFEQLHRYACNPENFWPQVRDEMTKLNSVFQTLHQTKKLIWIDSVAFISDVPGKNNGAHGLAGSGVCTDALIKLIREAKHSVDIQSPYLITSEIGQSLFREAVKRGVKIRILTNSLSSTDNIEAFSGYQRDREKLLETGVEIYEFRPDAAERYQLMQSALQKNMHYTPIFGLHAKSMVVDGKITVIGTFNLDPRSANLNTECVAVIYDAAITHNVLKGMEEEFKPANSWQTTLKWNPDSKAGLKKRISTWSKRIIPKAIL